MVGEHIQVLLCLGSAGRWLFCFPAAWFRDATEIDLLGEIDRSMMESRTGGEDEGGEPQRLTRAGEADLRNEPVNLGDEKLDEDDANDEDDDGWLIE